MSRLLLAPARPTFAAEDGSAHPSPGYVQAGVAADGSLYLDAATHAPTPEGATVVSEGPERYAVLAGTEHAPHVLRALVWRGPTLRSRANARASGSLARRIPATGRSSARPSASARALDVLAAARALAQEEPEAVSYQSVPMLEVGDEDVVESDTHRPHRWFGEAG